MKSKHVILGLLSLAGLVAACEQASAFFWHRHHMGKYSTYICCRPYNAFTPCCFGSIVCDGCCPLQTCPPMPPSAPYCGVPYPAPSLGNHYDLGCCAPDFSWGMAPPAHMTPEYPFVPPAPTPMPSQTSRMPAAMPSGIYTAGYLPYYYPVYPVSYNPYVTPGYWYGR